MGRFSSVQAYTDSNANARTVSYEQAAGSSQLKSGVVKPEKVVNPYGSAAGAGSGEFHVYRHARSRELERIETLKESEEEAKKDEEFQKMMEKNRQEELERTEKLRKKRQRQKEAKQRKKNLAKAGVTLTSGYDDGDDEEFTYEPAQPPSEVAAAGASSSVERDEESQSKTDVEDSKPAGETRRDGEPTQQSDAGASLPVGECCDESAKKDAEGEVVRRDNDDDNDDDDDDESVGPQPQPKRLKS